MGARGKARRVSDGADHALEDGPDMSTSRPKTSPRRLVTLGLLALATGGLTACDSLLGVDLPGQVTEDALFQPGQATILVNSAVSQFECAYSDFVASDAAGYEDVMTRDTGWWGGRHEFDPEPAQTDCNTTNTSTGWWTPLQAGRFIGEETYRRISEEWAPEEIDGEPEELLAELAIFNGATYGLLGEHFCEVSVDGGPMLGADETLDQAEQWLTDALDHIALAGDFALPAGSSPSASQLAYALRARVRLAGGDAAGAASDAALVEEGFAAFVTREDSGVRQRWNKVYNSHNEEQINTVIGAVDWWDGPPNPATGEEYPDVIPFTGYRDLAVLPDGRAVTADGYAVTLADEGAVLDPRTPVLDLERAFNEHPSWRQQKYPGLGADIPLAKWEEAQLILAKVEGGAAAVDRVNAIREHWNQAHPDEQVPLVTYVDAGDPDEVRALILEEERRVLFLEGRWWSTKIQERLWFPRGVGTVQPPTTFGYLGGVRLVMPENEYELNENFGLDSRATGCDPDEAPVGV